MAEQQQREYFSPSGNFVARLSRGQRVNTPEGFVRVDEKFAEFQPVAAGDYGRYQTSDPEEIEALDKRVNDGTGMVLTTEQFIERTTPDHVKVANLRRQLAEANNKLSAQMQTAKR